MDYRYLGRRAIVHYSYMIASLIFLASCAAGDLTDNLGPTDAEMTEAGVSADARGWNYLVSLTVSPATVSLQPGATRQFTVTAKLGDGRTVQGTPRYNRWSTTGGKIDENGFYTAPSERGVYQVIVRSKYVNVADTAVVTVTETATPTLTSITVLPGTVTLEPGAGRQFAVSGKLSDGTTTVPSVRWTATGGTISSDGRYTAGGAAGTYLAVATHESDLADTATITITGSDQEPPPASAVGCPTSGYRRVVNVASSYALSNALNSAQPGDQIQLASGTTYSGTLNLTRRGTSSDSITLCGPSTAIVSGTVNLTDATYWRLQGFQVKNGWAGIQSKRSTHNRISGLEIHQTGLMGIKLTEGSSHNVVTGNWIHHTGRSQSQYGEGVYVGEGQSSASLAQKIADYNRIEGNRFGPYVTAEHFDLKRETQGNVVRGNAHDATGFRLIWTNGQTAALGIADGTNQRVEGNTVRNLTFSDPNNWAVFRTYRGIGTVVTENVVIGPVSAKRFYDRDHSYGTTVRCDNVKPSTLPWGTTCAP